MVLACSLPLLSSAAFGQHLISFGIKGGVPLTDAFSYNSALIADALYRPSNLTTDARIILPNTLLHSSSDIRSGEFPILGKYHFSHLPLIRQYVECLPLVSSRLHPTSTRPNSWSASRSKPRRMTKLPDL